MLDEKEEEFEVRPEVLVQADIYSDDGLEVVGKYPLTQAQLDEAKVVGGDKLTVTGLLNLLTGR